MSRIAPPLVISEEQRAELESLSRSQTEPHRMVVRARALLMAADGESNTVVADEFGVSAATVRAWRDVFAAKGLTKFAEVAPGRGRKASISQERVEEIVYATGVHQAGRQDTLVVSGHGQGAGGFAGHGAADLVGAWPQTTPGAYIQAVQ